MHQIREIEDYGTELNTLLERIMDQIERVQHLVKQRVYGHKRIMLGPIEGWKEMIDPDSKATCKEMAILYELVEAKQLESRGREL